MKMAEAQLQHQPWRRLTTTATSGQSFLSYKNATVLLSILNVFLLLVLLRDISSSSDQFGSDRHVRESERIRQAMEPWQLIKTIRGIELENGRLKTAIGDYQMQTAAVDLSNRLKDIHSSNDAANVKALEEWRKRKMERARKREMERNGTFTS